MNSEMMKASAAPPPTTATQAVVAEVQSVAEAKSAGPPPRSPWPGSASARRPVIPIIGARRLDQFRDNLACLDLKLEPAQRERLDAASRIALGFPHDFYSNEMVKALVSGGMWNQIDA